MVDLYLVQNTGALTTIDVVCPKCSAKAFVLCDRSCLGVKERKKNIRFSCPACGYAVEYRNIPKFTGRVHICSTHLEAHLPMVDTDCDPYFGFELWYRKETTYGLLWAYNLEHLTAIENYIADKQHSHNSVPNRNNSLASRLSQWMKSANNRDYLQMTIQMLKQK